MYQCNTTQFVCLCSARREITPHTPRVGLLFSIFLSLFSQHCKNKQTTTYTIYLQCIEQFVLYRAKRYFQLGLLALFFGRLNCDYIYKRGKLIYA